MHEKQRNEGSLTFHAGFVRAHVGARSPNAKWHAHVNLGNLDPHYEIDLGDSKHPTFSIAQRLKQVQRRRWPFQPDDCGRLSVGNFTAATGPLRSYVVRKTTYGFGWNVEADASGKRVWHTGNTAGFRAFIEHRLDQEISVIMLSDGGNMM